MDIFFATSASYNELFKNEGSFNFVQTATTATLQPVGWNSFAAAFGDYDMDGDLGAPMGGLERRARCGK